MEPKRRKKPPHVEEWLRLNEKIALGTYRVPIACIVVNGGRNEAATLLEIRERDDGNLFIRCADKEFNVDAESTVVFKYGKDADGRAVFASL